MKLDHSMALLAHSQSLMDKMAPKAPMQQTPQNAPQQSQNPQTAQTPTQPQNVAPQGNSSPTEASPKPATSNDVSNNLVSLIKDLFAKEKADEDQERQQMQLEHKQEMDDIKNEITKALNENQ